MANSEAMTLIFLIKKRKKILQLLEIKIKIFNYIIKIMPFSSSPVNIKLPLPPSLEIDEEIIRQDINNPIIKQLYNLIKEEKETYDSLNDQMDEYDKKVFFETLRNYYFPDGFFTTKRVADKGFSKSEIQEIAQLLRPFKGKISRKRTAKGYKKRRYTKRKRPTKRRRPTKTRRPRKKI